MPIFHSMMSHPDAAFWKRARRRASDWQALRFVILPACAPASPSARSSSSPSSWRLRDGAHDELASASVSLMMMNAMSLLQYRRRQQRGHLLLLVLFTVAVMMRMVDIRKSCEMNGRRGPAFWCLAAFFALFVFFLSGPRSPSWSWSFPGPSGVSLSR